MDEIMPALVANGYFAVVPESEREDIIRACVTYNTLDLDGTRRLFFIDPEIVAGGIGDNSDEASSFIPSEISEFLKPFLERRFVFSAVAEQGQQYHISVDDRRMYKIWERSTDGPSAEYGVCFDRFSRMLQDLLDRYSVVPQSVYFNCWGNDGTIVFIPRACVEAIERYGFQQAYGLVLRTPGTNPPET